MRVVKETTSTTNNKEIKSRTPKRVISANQSTATPHSHAAKSSKTVLQKRSHTLSSAESTVMGVTLDVDKLKAIVKGYGEYPAKYRYVRMCGCTCLQLVCITA